MVTFYSSRSVVSTTALLAFVSAFLYGPTVALSADSNISTFGVGTCFDWAGTRHTVSDENDVLSGKALYDRTWLAGFLTGMNIASKNSKDLLRDIDLDTAMLWIETYCFQHSKDDVVTAGTKLIVELKKLSKSKK